MTDFASKYGFVLADSDSDGDDGGMASNVFSSVGASAQT